MLLAAVKLQLGNLSFADSSALRQRIGEIVATHKGIFRVGSLFSGCSMEMPALLCLESVWKNMFGRDISFQYVFAAEKVEWRRNFVIEQCKPKQAFGDVIELAEKDWEGKDYISGETRYLETCDILFAGFECDDRSLLNNKDRKTSDHGIEDNSGRTGSTARATLDLITKRRCRAFLENLKVLGQSNVNYLTKTLNDKRMIVITLMMQANHYGSRTRRERQWFYVAPVETHIDQLAEDYERPPWVSRFLTIVQAMRISAEPLSSFLFKEDDLRLAEWHSLERQRRVSLESRSKPGSSQNQILKWKTDHQILYSEHDLQWPPVLSGDMKLALSPWPESITERAYFLKCVHAKTSKTGERTHDLNMSLEYGSGADESFPCIVCSSKMYMISRGRMASWWECLRLQGYPVHRLGHLLLSQNQGMELAGNAFNGFVIPPLVVAAFILDPDIVSTHITPAASLPLDPVASSSEGESGEGFRLLIPDDESESEESDETA